MLRIGIVVGEPSGDQLGADFVRLLRANGCDLRVEGILGSQLVAAGGNAIFPMEQLAVMGLVEVLGRYFELTSIRNRMKQYFLRHPPDVFIGIDAPEFNLGLETGLRHAGIRTMHYVSPSVWAWRSGRVKKVARAADKLLTLFPFEAQFYSGLDLDVEYVGHPLADQIPLRVDKYQAREKLELPANKTIIALMPGSRASELKHHVQPFIETASLCDSQYPDLHFVTNMLRDEAKHYFLEELNRIAPTLPVSVYQGRSREVLQACDAALLASGTITLEAMLLKKPMVVAYKVVPLTYYILRKLIKSQWISLPNIISNTTLVPEFFQRDVRAEVLTPSLMHWIDDQSARVSLMAEFERLHKNMQLGANDRVAAAVLKMAQT